MSKKRKSSQTLDSESIKSEEDEQDYEYDDFEFEEEDEPDDLDDDEQDDFEDDEQGKLSLEKVQRVASEAENLKIKAVNHLVVCYRSGVLGFTKSKRKKNASETTGKDETPNPETFNLLALETFSILSRFIPAVGPDSGSIDLELRFSVTRRFLMTLMLQLEHMNDDIKLVNCALGVLKNPSVINWIVASRVLSQRFIKLLALLMATHPNRQVRANCLLYLQEHLKCLVEERVKVQITKSKIVVHNHYGEIDFLLKRSYRAVIKAASREHTLENHGLFKISQNCLAELFESAPVPNAYTLAFTSIRDLGINVRTEWASETKKQKKAASAHHMVMSVCSWSFLEAVNVWVSIVCKNRKELGDFVYPLTTVIMAAIKIKMPKTSYMPLVLHLIRALNRLSQGVDKYIPVACFVFGILDRLTLLDLKRMQRIGATNSTRATKHLMVTLRIQKRELQLPFIFYKIYRQIELLLLDHVGFVALHPSFPEYSIVLMDQLKRFHKSERADGDFCSFIKKIDTLIKDSNAKIKSLRKDLDMSKPIARVAILKAHTDKIAIAKYRHQVLTKDQAALANTIAALVTD
ncbi:Nucleolar complex protein 2 [Babesia duncani]|uniref:Nucleolar complex protein 2 n=1 Tax=Babesia duncani TaxID=323732 RepID=A0AAD9PHN7_9APIC|nr:Nucleolar complex protein 2 [Babesia duncani]KAK2196824.1 Nucleolar complex protein 2 [Babesia duncani]